MRFADIHACSRLKSRAVIFIKILVCKRYSPTFALHRNLFCNAFGA
jgi:hypothetical protein